MPDTPAIEAEALVRYYGKTRALAGLDLAVPPGTVYGLLGPNGAGKTTAVRVFATLLRPDGGRTAAGPGCSGTTWPPRPPRCGSAAA